MAASEIRKNAVIDMSDVVNEELPEHKISGNFENTDAPDVSANMKDHVTHFVWEQGRKRAQEAFNVYANIDILRPYFHVELHEVRSRLVGALIPEFSQASKSILVGELYGPFMLVLTLIALVLFSMKSAGTVVKEGTLMGTAFFLSFGYWLGASSFVYLVTYVCSTRVSFVQMLSLIGYGLFGHCIALILGMAFHPDDSHVFFYVVWIVFGGLAALKIVTVLMFRTSGPSQKLVVGGVVASLNLLFPLYLHFTFHKIVRVITQM